MKLAGGETVHLRVPHYSIVDLGYGPLAPGTMMSPRVAPPMIGLGLLEAVPEEQILANADPDDANQGRHLRQAQPGLVAREQQGDARPLRLEGRRANHRPAGGGGGQRRYRPFHHDDPAQPRATAPRSEKDCLDAPNGNSPQYQDVELGDDLFKLVAFYSHNLAVPPRRNPADPKVLKGKELFYSIGCASCHKPKFVTGEAPGQPHLSHQLIWPYTDLLLHDMGEGLADNRPEGEASASEWRTAPLWGIGLTETVNGHTLFLHDGRARNPSPRRFFGMAARARPRATNSPSSPKRTGSASSLS